MTSEFSEAKIDDPQFFYSDLQIQEGNKFHMKNNLDETRVGC